VDHASDEARSLEIRRREIEVRHHDALVRLRGILEEQIGIEPDLA
jgi:hypothetical protein